MQQRNESQANQDSPYPSRRELRAAAEPQPRTRRELRAMAESERHLGRASLEGFLRDQQDRLAPEHRMLLDQMRSLLDQIPERSDRDTTA